MTENRLAELEQSIGHTFRQPELLERALTHRSASSVSDHCRVSANNEQLEYLGDAVLGMLVSEALIERFSDWNEGQLSKCRARLVNSGALCGAASRLNLGKYLRLGKGEEKTGGREKPGLLADAFEAVVAAIYLDAGLSSARGFVKRALLDPAIEEQASELKLLDYKSALQELLQGRKFPPARYAIVQERGPDHEKTFLVEIEVEGVLTATGAGSSKKEAEQAAAASAFKQLRAERAEIE
jgi:ribonuclease-3